MKKTDSLSAPRERLMSLDILRGVDLLALVVIEVLIYPLERAVDAPWFQKVMWWFTHMGWEGFSSWDLVMPLFMFMAGVSIPFAMSKYRSDRARAVRHILKRGVLLWIFGMVCQGNLLALDIDHIYLFSNTLQAIAVGYVGSALLYLFAGQRWQVASCAILFALYWIGMQFFSIGDYGHGGFAPDNNFAEGLERLVLGRFRDGASVVDGEVVFAHGYHYTWIWSSLNFVVTVMTGVFAGEILKNRGLPGARRAAWLLGIGVAMCAAGWALHPVYPVIKKLWTGSMVLVSSGYCFMLMSLFYYVIDCKGRGRKRLAWLNVYGQNSLAAYMLALCVSFNSVGTSLLFGFQQFLGDFYPVLIALCNVSLNYFILWLMYRNRIFLKA